MAMYVNGVYKEGSIWQHQQGLQGFVSRLAPGATLQTISDSVFTCRPLWRGLVWMPAKQSQGRAAAR